VLADSLYNYTKKTLQALKNKGLLPEFVQVGNETNGGMCFPGSGTVTWPTDWSKQTLLFNAGIRAVRDVDANTRVILHVADPQNAEWWAGQLNGNGVTGYDILGVSFYPTWHTTKTINDFGTIITSIKNTYQKDVMVVETGLPWTNSWDDNTTNIMNGAPANYGATPTPEIQAQWLIDLANKMAAAGGIGMIYWEPAWVASHVSGCPAESGGSAWENVALFDFNNNLQMNGGIRFFQLSTGISKPASLNENPSLTIISNPVTNELIIQFNAQYNARVLVEIMDLQGRIIKTFTEKTVPGPNKFLVNISELKAVSGMYILHLSSNELSGNQRFILNR
jgi:arabinogalactan endo-1,4-beta-galactosidase